MKEIPGFSGRYLISTKGEIYGTYRNKYLKPDLHKCGYYRIELTDGIVVKKYLVHRLVLLTYKGSDKAKPHCNHKNGIKTDNRLENLEWATIAENNLHAYSLGLKSAKGSKNGCAKLTENDVMKIRKMYTTGKYTHDKLGSLFGVCRASIGLIVKNKTWIHC